MDEFDVLSPVAGGKAFPVRAKRVEIDVMPCRFLPLVTFLEVLLLVVTVYMEPDTFIKIAHDWRSVQVDRQLLIGNVVNPV